MIITLENIGKRFNFNWIFQNVNIVFESGNYYAIKGNNGSGKSTLLKIIAGQMMSSSGEIVIKDDNDKIVHPDNLYLHYSIAAPYLELPLELTLKELISFHFNFKKTRDSLSTNEILQLSGLIDHQNKHIADFSSGMKQRIKTTLAVLSDTNILLLDEPLSNLDEKGVVWYKELIKNFSSNRIVIVASNDDDNEVFMHKTAISLNNSLK